MKLIGKTPINPLLFYTGKIICIVTWLLPFAKWFGIYSFGNNSLLISNIIALSFGITGLFFYTASLISLGESTRMGLPDSDTVLKTTGLYRHSRNPMYLGFALMQIAVVLYLLHWIAVVMTVYSIVVHHCIILSEEKFCEKQFGKAYKKYKTKVRMYL